MRILSMTLLTFFLLLSTASAALVHTSTLPKGISYTPEELPTHAVYLEGEALGKHNKEDTFPKGHQPITVFRTTAKPNDYWGAYVPYDKSRLAARGAEKRSYPKHHLIWKNIGPVLEPGIYDVYVRCMITAGGSQTFAFKKGSDLKSLQHAKNTKSVTHDKANLSWVRIGSVDLLEKDDCFELTVSTKQTPVRIDTVLLVKTPDAKALPVKFQRLPNADAASDRPGGLIFATETAVVTYDVQSPEKIKNLTMTLTGLNGETLQKKTLPALKPTDDGHARLEVKLPGRGYFVVTLQAKTKNQHRLKTTTTVAVLGTPIDDAIRMKSRFGLWTVHGDKPLLKAANGRWNRRLMSLFRVKKTDLVAMDAAKKKTSSPLDSFKLKSYDWVGALSFGLPNWLMDISPEKKHGGFGNAFSPPEDWDQLDKVLDYYFQKNKDRLPGFFEVYNEPIAHWKGSNAQLVRFHHAVARAVKKVRPDIKILGPCLSSIQMDKLEQLASLGLFDKLDGIVMHAYVNNTTPEAIFLDRLIQLAAFRKRPKYAHLPIFLTEFGWTSAEGTWQVPVDELTQAQFCARSLALCLSENIDAMVYFCMAFRAKGEGEAGFSLIDSTGRPKPGFAAFSTLAREFADATPVTRMKLLPDVYMVVAKRLDHYVASVWSTNQNHTLQFPFPITSAVNMVGQPITLNLKKHPRKHPLVQLSVSPSPIYIQMDDFPIDEPLLGQNALHLQGQDMPVGSGELFAFHSDWYKQGKLQIPSNAPPGSYLLLTKKGDRWQPQTITVQRPFDITSTKVDWPLKEKFPTLRVTLTSQIDLETLPVWISLKTAQFKSTPTLYPLPPRTTREARFDLKDIPFGERLQATLYARSKWQGKSIVLKDLLDVTVVPAYQTSKMKTWDQIPAMDFTNWKPLRTLHNIDQTQPDCMAELKCRYNAKILELAVRVRDDEHRQTKAEKNASRMWAEDSLQLAFDMDMDKPWVAGVGGQDLLGGHRVFEFTIGKNTNRPTGVAFRHTSYLKKLPANMIEPDIKVQVTRREGVTDYRIVIPWKILGVDEAMTPGQRIGFALLVNDVDPVAKRPRHGVRLFAGIAQSKDPKLFGPLWLR